jgi:alpha-1,3-rhamnosyltransferase
VYETLESAKAQTYQNIELIVSDDCSTDATIEICKTWIEESKDRFVRIKLLTIEKNTGIAPNCNRGIKEALGEWVKLIAGDDILMNNCITLGVNFFHSNPTSQIFASRAILFENGKWENSTSTCKSNELNFFKSATDSKDQLLLLLRNNQIKAPTVFFKKQLWINNSGFDESIPFMEDYPFWIKTLKQGIKIDFLNEITVAYRMSNESISGYDRNALFNSYYKNEYIYKRYYLKDEYGVIEFLIIKYDYAIKLIFEKLGINSLRYKWLFIFILKINILRYI